MESGSSGKKHGLTDRQAESLLKNSKQARRRLPDEKVQLAIKIQIYKCQNWIAIFFRLFFDVKCSIYLLVHYI